jgi:hypothetical protein
MTNVTPSSGCIFTDLGVEPPTYDELMDRFKALHDAFNAIVTLPEDIVDQLLKIGPVYWGHVGPKPEAEHLADLTTAIRNTREHFEMPETQDLDMHGLYTKEDAVVCHTGVSPNSPKHAQILVGAWNMMHQWALVQRGEQVKDLAA